MPRFAANLTMLFTEDPFLNRFALARIGGFRAVEFLFPYPYSKEEIKTNQLKLHRKILNTINYLYHYLL